MSAEVLTTSSTELCRNTLEDALLYLDELCDGAAKSDGHGFNRDDSEILRPRAKTLRETGELDSRKYILKKLEKYKETQLKPAGFDYEEIKRSEKGKSNQNQLQKANSEILVDPIITEKAWKILCEEIESNLISNIIGYCQTMEAVH
jgi:hypothetical protein